MVATGFRSAVGWAPFYGLSVSQITGIAEGLAMDRATLERFITDWLARAHRVSPDTAHTEWRTQGVALLHLGQRFSAVRLPERLVRAAVGSADMAEIADTLAARLQGPVIRDSLAVGRPCYALIEWHAGLVWEDGEDTPCLGDGTHLGVPHISRVSPPGTYWLVPPRDAGDLCRPEHVQQLVRDAQAVMANAEAAL